MTGPEASQAPFLSIGHARLGRAVIAGAVLGLTIVIVYGRSRGLGLWADDFQWVDGAYHATTADRWNPFRHGHFYRPLVGVYFDAAVASCGWSAPCFHTLNLVAHGLTSLAVCALAAAVAESFPVGLLAGVLFAAQPGPVEAVTWVSAISEVQATLAVVVAVWLFHRAARHGSRGAYAASIVAYVVALLTHESAIVALPLMALLPLADGPQPAARRRARLLRLMPYVIVTAISLGIAVVVNARNYVVTEGEYRVGLHIVTNIAHALVSLAVARRDLLGVLVVVTAMAAAGTIAPARVRYFVWWTAIALMPFSLFRFGLPSRYLYLAAVGFASMTAVLLWWLRGSLMRRGAVGLALWTLVTIGVIARSAVFTIRNVRVSAAASRPFDAYAAEILTREPHPNAGATLAVPAPPAAVGENIVETLLRWTYRDPELRVDIQPMSGGDDGPR
jgi:hypothetical protein